MAMTQIRSNEWELKHDGKVIPRIHFDPVTIQGIRFNQLHCYSFQWLMERGLGINALIFLEIHPGTKTARITHVNMPALPSLIYYCICGKLLSEVGRHLQCLETGKKCTRRGRHIWTHYIPLDHVNASLVYNAAHWRFVRDNPTYFQPRHVHHKEDVCEGT